MKGIGRRVTIGFLSIVALLFVSGIISLFELGNLSNDTEKILAASRRNMEIAKDMLKSAHEHSQAVLYVVVFDEQSRKDDCSRSMGDLEGRLATARSEAVSASRLDSLAMSVSRLREVTERFMFSRAIAGIDLSLIAGEEPASGVSASAVAGKKWYEESYKVAYDDLVDDIQNFMTHTHSSLAPRAEQLNKNAYRSVAPVFIAQVVMIAIVLMFYYFMRIYCVRPIERINSSLSNYLNYRLPFSVKSDLLDDYKELVEYIEKLIALLKQNR